MDFVVERFAPAPESSGGDVWPSPDSVDSYDAETRMECRMANDKKRRKFEAEFKAEFVRLVLDGGRSVPDVCRVRAFEAQVARRGPVTPAALHPLATRGSAVAPALSAETCARLQTVLDASERGSVYADAFGKTGLQALMSEAFSGERAEAVRHLFGTEFVAVFVTLDRNWDEAGMERRGRKVNSTLWHCDGGPTEQCRVLVYLNGPEDHDSATWVADLPSTEALKRAGYVHCDLHHRRADLGPLCDRLGIDFSPTPLTPERGEAILVNPARHMHRKELPTRGFRDALSCGLVPTPVSWRRFLDSAWPVVAQNQNADFRGSAEGQRRSADVAAHPSGPSDDHAVGTPTRSRSHSVSLNPLCPPICQASRKSSGSPSNTRGSRASAIDRWSGRALDSHPMSRCRRTE